MPDATSTTQKQETRQHYFAKRKCSSVRRSSRNHITKLNKATSLVLNGFNFELVPARVQAIEQRGVIQPNAAELCSMCCDDDGLSLYVDKASLLDFTF